MASLQVSHREYHISGRVPMCWDQFQLELLLAGSEKPTDPTNSGSVHVLNFDTKDVIRFCWHLIGWIWHYTLMVKGIQTDNDWSKLKSFHSVNNYHFCKSFWLHIPQLYSTVLLQGIFKTKFWFLNNIKYEKVLEYTDHEY